MDSKRLAEGRERSVMSGFELRGWHVAEVAVQVFGVVPVHPAERRELDVLDGLPWSLSRPADKFGLVEPVHRFRERVVVAVTDRTDRRFCAEVGESFAVTDARVLPEFKGSSQRCLVAVSIDTYQKPRRVSSSRESCGDDY